MNSVLRLADLPVAEIEHLLELAARFGRDGIPAARPGRFVCGLFFNPSLRTRTSLEIATRALGAHCIVHDVGRGVWKLETRPGAVMDGDAAEHVRDAIGNFLSDAVDCLAVRAFADPALPFAENRADPVLTAVARAATVPLINLESAMAHPMQGLGDLLVLKSHRPRTVAVTWAYHPRPLPMAVANTALSAFRRAGYDVRLVRPEGFDLVAEDDVDVPVHHDLAEGLAGVDVVYAKSWGAASEYGPDADRTRREGLRDWIIDRSRAGDAAFMHCLPVRRNVVVTDEVIDGPRSWVAEQAHARILTQAAVLHELL
ncbi:MAG: N-acetylornithine carbamoyltransferase [Planctomycetota bacterium]|jgi:ornithine carbamoyltransferase